MTSPSPVVIRKKRELQLSDRKRARDIWHSWSPSTVCYPRETTAAASSLPLPARAALRHQSRVAPCGGFPGNIGRQRAMVAASQSAIFVPTTNQLRLSAI